MITFDFDAIDEPYRTVATLRVIFLRFHEAVCRRDPVGAGPHWDAFAEQNLNSMEFAQRLIESAVSTPAECNALADDLIATWPDLAQHITRNEA